MSGDGAWKNCVEEGLFVWTSGKKIKPRVIEEREYVGGVCVLRTVVKKKRKKVAVKKCPNLKFYLTNISLIITTK